MEEEVKKYICEVVFTDNKRLLIPMQYDWSLTNMLNRDYEDFINIEGYNIQKCFIKHLTIYKNPDYKEEE